MLEMVMLDVWRACELRHYQRRTGYAVPPTMFCALPDPVSHARSVRAGIANPGPLRTSVRCLGHERHDPQWRTAATLDFHGQGDNLRALVGHKVKMVDILKHGNFMPQ